MNFLNGLGHDIVSAASQLVHEAADTVQRVTGVAEDLDSAPIGPGFYSIRGASRAKGFQTCEGSLTSDRQGDQPCPHVIGHLFLSSASQSNGGGWGERKTSVGMNGRLGTVGLGSVRPGLLTELPPGPRITFEAVQRNGLKQIVLPKALGRWDSCSACGAHHGWTARLLLRLRHPVVPITGHKPIVYVWMDVQDIMGTDEIEGDNLSYAGQIIFYPRTPRLTSHRSKRSSLLKSDSTSSNAFSISITSDEEVDAKSKKNQGHDSSRNAYQPFIPTSRTYAVDHYPEQESSIKNNTNTRIDPQTGLETSLNRPANVMLPEHPMERKPSEFESHTSSTLQAPNLSPKYRAPFSHTVVASPPPTTTPAASNRFSTESEAIDELTSLYESWAKDPRGGRRPLKELLRDIEMDRGSILGPLAKTIAVEQRQFAISDDLMDDDVAIKKLYLKACRLFHPDKLTQGSIEEKARASLIFDAMRLALTEPNAMPQF